MTLMLNARDMRNLREAAPLASGTPLSGGNVLATGALAYIAIGVVFLYYVGINPLAFLVALPHSFQTLVSMAQLLVPWWGVPAVAVAMVAAGPVRRRLWQRKAQILSGVLLCGGLTMMFGLIKNNLPLIVPFWADDFFTHADRALHFGHAPYELLAWLAPLNTDGLLKFYMNGWVFFATFFPVLLIAFDDNAARRRTFTILWLGCWIGLGNVLALAFMSYGPIFADLFPGGPADLHQGALALLDRADASALMQVKMKLWYAYTGESGMLASGISAFPSVHVGMATVLGLYVARLGADIARAETLTRQAAAGLVLFARGAGGLYVAAYLVLSVYLGWHYALDGYASILVMGGAYLLLRRREPAVAPISAALG